MTRTLLIHCGMPKAGSSTLQDEMRILARDNPSLFSFRHLYPDTCDQLTSGNEKTLLTFRNLFAHCQVSDKSCMMSQEVLSQKSQSVKVLLELASGYFDRIEVFFLIRDPAASILSAYQQWGKVTTTSTFLRVLLNVAARTFSWLKRMDSRRNSVDCFLRIDNKIV